MILIQFELPFSSENLKHKFIFSLPEPTQKITTATGYKEYIFRVFPPILKRVIDVAADDAGEYPSCKIQNIINLLVSSHVYEQVVSQLMKK